MTDQHDTLTADLPTPGAGPQMRMVEVALIEESLTNPRKHFDAAKLKELADSITASGVHQPILLRPLPGSRVPDTWGFRRQGAPLPAYELVAGARRLRACRLAKVAEIPAMIRELTDEQALEIQVIENLQREDVTPLEEAEGYEVLMKAGHITADQVGEKIGKSRSYVYARLKVLDLCSMARDALRDGRIDFSRGLLIARIPDDSLQFKALEHCTSKNWQGDTPSYRSCATYIQENFMLKLSAARFKIADATLIEAAGSCKACPKRTGANPDLFSDVGSADVCTDPKCYHAKEEAHSARAKAEALEAGQTIIDGREAKALMPHSYSSRVEGYLRLDDAVDSPTDKPLRKLIGKAMDAAGVKPTLVANPHKDGQLIAVLLPEQVTPLLAAAGHDELAQKAEKEAQRDEEAAKKEEAAKRRTAYETQWRWQLLECICATLRAESKFGASDDVIRVAARHFASLLNMDQAKKLCKLLELGKVAPKEGLKQWVEDTDAGQALMILLAYRDVNYHEWADRYGDDRGVNQNPILRLIAAECELKPEAIQATVKAEQRAAAKAQAEAEKAAAPETASTPPPAAQATPTRAKSKKSTAPAALARDNAHAKTSKAEASAQIAAALDGLEAENQAPTAQGNEAPPVAGAQASASAAPSTTDRAMPRLKNQAPAAQGNEALPAAHAQAAATAAPEATAGQLHPAAAWPLPTTSTPAPAAASAVAPGGEAGACVSNGAAAKSGELAIDAQVRVRPNATGKKQAPHIGKVGKILRRVGPEAWDVAIPREKRGVPMFVAFHSSELEVVNG